jgi:hypothetical protein
MNVVRKYHIPRVVEIPALENSMKLSRTEGLWFCHGSEPTEYLITISKIMEVYFYYNWNYRVREHDNSGHHVLTLVLITMN